MTITCVRLHRIVHFGQHADHQCDGFYLGDAFDPRIKRHQCLPHHLLHAETEEIDNPVRTVNRIGQGLVGTASAAMIVMMMVSRYLPPI